MAIPDGKLYDNGVLGAGAVAGTGPTTINTEKAGATVGFGLGVTLSGGKAVPATTAPIYGVSVRRNYTVGYTLNDETKDADAYQEGEAMGVLREGSIAVQISSDVEAGDNATVDASGKFKEAASGDTVVGVFRTAGKAGETAVLQTSFQFGTAPASAPAAASAPAGSTSAGTGK